MSVPPGEAAIAAPECARCGVAMTTGFEIDGMKPGGLQTWWVSGAPRRGFAAALGGSASSAQDRYPVTTYRCPRCGRLESYAVWGG